MNKRFIILILILSAFFALSACSGSAAPEPEEAFQPDTADDFALEDLDGYLVSVSDFRGSIVVLNFWASWCPPCRQEMPDLNELDLEFKERGEVVLLTVNLTDGQRETRETARSYIEENGFGFTVLFDDRGVLANEYGIAAIPQTFILDRDGQISGAIIGATTSAAILEKIDAVK